MIGRATNNASGATDETMLDASSHSDKQLDWSVINAADENSLDMSYAITPSIEQNTLAELPVAELIELYDELSNRVTATVIAINDDVTMSSDSSPSSIDTRGLFNYVYNKLYNSNNNNYIILFIINYKYTK